MSRITEKNLDKMSFSELCSYVHAALGRVHEKAVHAESKSCTSPEEQKESLEEARAWANEARRGVVAISRHSPQLTEQTFRFVEALTVAEGFCITQIFHASMYLQLNLAPTEQEDRLMRLVKPEKKESYNGIVRGKDRYSSSMFDTREEAEAFVAEKMKNGFEEGEVVVVPPTRW